jgi:outer membrane protein TolC
MPTINWNAQMTFQSEAINLELPIPNFEAVQMPLLRGQTTLDLNYTIFDGGILNAQKDGLKTELAVQNQQIEVEFEKVKPQITQAFLGIILLRQKIKVLEQAIKTIKERQPPLEVAIENGVALPSGLQRLKIEIKKIENSIGEINGSISVLISILEAWTGKDFDKHIKINLPNLETANFAEHIQHPQHQLFELTKQQILSKESLLTARQQPKVGTFLQAGIGYPNPLNFFENEVSPFAIAGVKFQWNFWDWGQTEKEREILSVSTKIMDVQKQAFDKSLSIADQRYEAEIKKIEGLLKNDEEVIAMYDTLIKELKTQVDNGVTTTTEYIAQVNEQTQAKIQLETRKVQLKQVKVEYLSHLGQI